MELSNTLVSFMTPSKAQRIIARNIKEGRLHLNLTQEGLAERSGVPISTLRKGEQKGVISLESFLKILMVLGMLDSVVKATEVSLAPYSSIDEVIAHNTQPKRKRGRRT